MFEHIRDIPQGQHWLLRCLPGLAIPECAGLTVLQAVGPFGLEQELLTLRSHAIDVLVCKNSGGSAVDQKLAAARLLELPVIMIQRPLLPDCARTFADIDALCAAVTELHAS